MNRSIIAAVFLAPLAGCDNTIKDHFERAQAVSLVAPANLQGTPAANGASIQLTWVDTSSGETGYRVEGNDAPFGASIPLIVQTLPADSTSFDMPTQPNTTYYVRVVATFGAQESSPSAVIIVVTPNVPAAPSSLTAMAMSGGRFFVTYWINLAWINPPGSITANRVERSLDGGSTWSTRFTFGTATTAVTDSGLSPDTPYCYRVFASNANGEGAPSMPACAITPTNAVAIASTAAPAVVGRHASLAVSGGAVRHVAHYDVTNGDVLYTTDSGGPLPVVTVDAGPTGVQDVGGDGTGVALDGSGFVHIAAHDVSSGKLRYITNASGSFVASTLDPSGFNGLAPRIAVSPLDGSIHVLYLDDLPGSDNLRHASRIPPGGAWSFEGILPSATTLISWALAIDPSGGLHVSYAHTDDGLTYELVHGKKTGVTWTFTPVTSAGRPGRNSIAVDGSGLPHLTYYEQANFRLMHAASTGTIWSTELVHGVAGTDLGTYNSLAINPSTGRLHVAYYDATSQDLRYARKDPGGSWVLKLIDANGDVGAYASLGLDGAGNVHIGYHDATNGELKVAGGSP